MYKQRLKEYIEKDVIYQAYKEQKEFESSDFDNFCILHCEDIEEALFDLEQLQQENKEQEEYITYWQKEMDKRQDKIDKAIEYIKRYVFMDLPQLIKLVEILKDSDVDE